MNSTIKTTIDTHSLDLQVNLLPLDLATIEGFHSVLGALWVLKGGPGLPGRPVLLVPEDLARVHVPVRGQHLHQLLLRDVIVQPRDVDRSAALGETFEMRVVLLVRLDEGLFFKAWSRLKGSNSGVPRSILP